MDETRPWSAEEKEAAAKYDQQRKENLSARLNRSAEIVRKKRELEKTVGEHKLAEAMKTANPFFGESGHDLKTAEAELKKGDNKKIAQILESIDIPKKFPEGTNPGFGETIPLSEDDLEEIK